MKKVMVKVKKAKAPAKFSPKKFEKARSKTFRLGIEEDKGKM